MYAFLKASDAMTEPTCGLVWTHVDPERLRTVLREAGTAETRDQFAAAEDRGAASEPAG
jgi:hypothetical protein